MIAAQLIFTSDCGLLEFEQSIYKKAATDACLKTILGGNSVYVSKQNNLYLSKYELY